MVSQEIFIIFVTAYATYSLDEQKVADISYLFSCAKAGKTKLIGGCYGN